MKGPKSDFSFEVFFARDAARTPLVGADSAGARNPVAGAGALNARRVFLARCRRRAAGSPITRKRCWSSCGVAVDLEVFSASGPAVRSRALRYRALPDRQQRLSRFRLRDRAAAPRRGGDARIQSAPPDRRSHDQARRLGRLRARVRVQRRRDGPRVRRARPQAGGRAGLRRRSR